MLIKAIYNIIHTIWYNHALTGSVEYSFKGLEGEIVAQSDLRWHLQAYISLFLVLNFVLCCCREETQSLQRELAGLSERYSQKCLELNRAEQANAEREREISRKERDTEQLRKENLVS